MTVVVEPVTLKSPPIKRSPEILPPVLSNFVLSAIIPRLEAVFCLFVIEVVTAVKLADTESPRVLISVVRFEDSVVLAVAAFEDTESPRVPISVVRFEDNVVLPVAAVEDMESALVFKVTTSPDKEDAAVEDTEFAALTISAESVEDRLFLATSALDETEIDLRAAVDDTEAALLKRSAFKAAPAADALEDAVIIPDSFVTTLADKESSLTSSEEIEAAIAADKELRVLSNPVICAFLN